MPEAGRNPLRRRHVSVRLPQKLIAYVDEQSAARFQSRSQFITGLIAASLEAHQQQTRA